MLRKLVIFALAGVAVYYLYPREENQATHYVAAAQPAWNSIGTAFAERRSNVIVQSAGSVSRVLPDDNDGSRHQRFVLALPSGQTVLIAHNIDLAPRVDGLKSGDRVEFSGEYEWNAQGGVVHWTHRDPQRRHQAGWLRHNGRTYQ